MSRPSPSTKRRLAPPLGGVTVVVSCVYAVVVDQASVAPRIHVSVVTRPNSSYLKTVLFSQAARHRRVPAVPVAA